MIADRIDAYLESGGAELPEAILETATKICGASMLRNFGVQEDTIRKERMPRPSGSWACPRQMVFDSLSLEVEPYRARALRTFTHGDMTEAMGVLLFRQAAPEDIITPDIDGEQLELTVEFDPADYGVEGDPFTLEGHIDMTIRGKDGQEEPVDWKSSSRYGFQNAKAGAGDPTHDWWTKEAGGYIAQLRWYMLMLRASGRSEANRGYLAFVCKDTGHTCEVMVPADEEAEKTLIKKAAYVFQQIPDAQEKRAVILEGTGTTHDPYRRMPRDPSKIKAGAAKVLEKFAKDGEQFEGDETTDARISAWVRQHVPRARFTENLKVEKAGATMRPDGTKGPCHELSTKAHLEGFRCSYCAHTARCWPGFQVVALSSGPVWRTNKP